MLRIAETQQRSYRPLRDGLQVRFQAANFALRLHAAPLVLPQLFGLSALLVFRDLGALLHRLERPLGALHMRAAVPLLRRRSLELFQRPRRARHLPRRFHLHLQVSVKTRRAPLERRLSSLQGLGLARRVARARFLLRHRAPQPRERGVVLLLCRHRRQL